MQHNAKRNSHNRLVHRIILCHLKAVIPKYSKGRLLDIGCGDKPYEDLARAFVDEYVGLDHICSQHSLSKADIIADSHNAPIKDHSCDTILATSVLEHLERPNDAIGEMHRILRTGGHVILTCPFFWHLHEEPRDFFRFSKYGLRYLFESNGFEVLELKALSGFWVTFGQLFVYYLYRFRRGGKLSPLWWLIPAIGSIVQGIAYMLDHLDKAEQWTWMYMVVARKK